MGLPGKARGNRAKRLEELRSQRLHPMCAHNNHESCPLTDLSCECWCHTDLRGYSPDTAEPQPEENTDMHRPTEFNHTVVKLEPPPGVKTDSGVIWEAPPPGRQREQAYNFAPQLNDLLRQPGAWGRIHTFDTSKQASSVAGSLRQGRYGVPPNTLWEIRSAKLEGGGGGIWARFIGYQKDKKS